jgi:hypothetical protein
MPSTLNLLSKRVAPIPQVDDFYLGGLIFNRRFSGRGKERQRFWRGANTTLVNTRLNLLENRGLYDLKSHGHTGERRQVDKIGESTGQ